MAMVVMVIVRPVLWMRDLINAYHTISNAAHSVKFEPCRPAVLCLAALLILVLSSRQLRHTALWPPSLSPRTVRLTMEPIGQTDLPGDVVKVVLGFSVLLLLILAAPAFSLPADSPVAEAGNEHDPNVLVLNASQMQALEARAQAGEANAQYVLGAAYRKGGPLLEKKPAATVQWWQNAAEQGNVKAQNGLGYMYHTGEGVARDYVQAAKWYRMAAEQGDAVAENNLGNLYFAGKGVHRSYSSAFDWVGKAARQGLTTAQHALALMYRFGKGTPRNLPEALRLYAQAASKGLPQAQNELGSMYLSGEGVDRNCSEAFRWFHLAAEQSFPDAENNLGYLYATGQGTSRDYKEARNWFNRAAEQGLPAAELNLGSLYATGRGAPLNYVEGYMWFSLAASQGSKGAVSARNNLRIIMTRQQLELSEARIAGWRLQHFSAQQPEAQ